MSNLAVLRRVGPSFAAVSKDASRFKSRASSLPLIQTRHFEHDPSEKQSFRGGQGGKRKEKKALKRKDEQPLFTPLSTNQMAVFTDFGANRESALKLPAFNPDKIQPRMIGKAVEFPQKDREVYKIYGLPKRLLLEFRLLSKPCSVVRDVTVSTVEMLEKASVTPSLANRLVITGRPGSGKSFLLLQAVEYCFSKDWIVLYIPRAVSLVNSTTAFVYDPRTQTYLQPTYSYQILDRLLKVNAQRFSSLSSKNSYTFERREFPIGTALSELIAIGLRDQSNAPAVLDIVTQELQQQDTYPVLLAVDDFQAIYSRTSYKNPQFQNIKSFHLSIPRLLMEFASGKRVFKRGAILGAIGTSDPVYSLSLELREALGLPYDSPPSPWDRRSRTMIEYARGLKALPVPEQLSVPEATSLFEVWMKDKALVSSAYDDLFMSKYTESSGNPRAFVWRGLLSTLQS